MTDSKKIWRGRIDTVAVIMLMLSGMLIFTMPTAHAAGGDLIINGMLDCINSGVSDVIKKEMDPGSTYMEFVTGHGDNSIFSNIMNACLGIGAFMCIITGFIRAFKNMDRGMDPWECIIKMFQEVFIVGIFMVNLPTVLEKLYELGMWLIDMAGDTSASTGAGLTIDMLDSIFHYGITFGPVDWIKTFCILAIPFILSFLGMGVAYFTCFSLLIEIAIRRAFCPAAVYDIYGEGLRSPGMRYLKRYFATYVKVAICIIVARIGVIFLEQCVSGLGAVADPWTLIQFLIEVVAINLTIIGFMQRAGEFANDIVGA